MGNIPKISSSSCNEFYNRMFPVVSFSTSTVSRINMLYYTILYYILLYYILYEKIYILL